MRSTAQGSLVRPSASVTTATGRLLPGTVLQPCDPARNRYAGPVQFGSLRLVWPSPEDGASTWMQSRTRRCTPAAIRRIRGRHRAHEGAGQCRDEQVAPLPGLPGLHRDRTLAGRAERLSERTVGRRALGRSDTFDGRFDASVRVRAGRVRKSLEEYYAEEGRADRVRSSCPRVPMSRDSSGRRPRSRRTRWRARTSTRPSWSSSSGVRGHPGRPRRHDISELIAQRLATFPGLRVSGPPRRGRRIRVGRPGSWRPVRAPGRGRLPRSVGPAQRPPDRCLPG